MKIVRRIVALGVLLGLLHLGWALLSVRSLDQALQEGGTDKLEGSVDFPRLRASLKTEFQQQLSGTVAEVTDSSLLRDLTDALAPRLLDPLVDVYVTAEGLADLIETGRVREDLDFGGNPDEEGEQGFRWGNVRWVWFEHPGRLKVTLKNDTRLLFEPRGLRWKLVAVDLPALAAG